MASTTCAMHFDPGPFSSIDCQRLPRCHLSISFWVFLLVVFHLWVSTLMLFSPTWCSSFWLHVLPTVLSCTSLFLLYLSPLFSILLSRSWSCLSRNCVWRRLLLAQDENDNVLDDLFNDFDPAPGKKNKTGPTPNDLTGHAVPVRNNPVGGLSTLETTCDYSRRIVRFREVA